MSAEKVLTVAIFVRTSLRWKKAIKCKTVCESMRGGFMAQKGIYPQMDKEPGRERPTPMAGMHYLNLTLVR